MNDPGRSITTNAVVARQLQNFTSPTLQASLHGHWRTRYQMQEDSQFMEGVILFFKDVQYDPSEMRLVYLPDSSDWTPPWAHQQQPVNIRLRAPILQPYRHVVTNKRQKLDFGYWNCGIDALLQKKENKEWACQRVKLFRIFKLLKYMRAIPAFYSVPLDYCPRFEWLKY